MRLTRGFKLKVLWNTTVKMTFITITGFKAGNVIFQKHSQPEAPSILAASYIDLSSFWRPAKKMRVWMPLNQRMTTKLVIKVFKSPTTKAGTLWLRAE